ncbi:helix-turn-helix domain-containing protein [Chryseobacterium sp. WLY505]|uniref:AlbA family DNA-binding domain-containing protein n=1 Tax=Chryseobacterium sp. WLY505 TaxID=3068892 RepID=UPI002796DD13|nr:ATP-binding protein [Chryseobacterium sp. WLY505]MDQ1859000.1 ATP-binding protein [Chryseobacterium sp. WLY505]
MYYSELFFKKNIYDIVEEDLINFFNEEQEESSILEFKSGDVKLEKVYQEVAALHNSQGGLIVIGSPKPTKDGNGKESFKGDLTKSIHKHKDWLYQKISSNISPAPSNLRIHDVQIKDGGMTQIIDIPKSDTPPHQCLHNGIYYLRFETETRHAPHGLVEAMFNRRQEPIIDCSITSMHLRLEKSITFNFVNTSDYPLIGLHYNIVFYNISKSQYFDTKNQSWIELDKKEILFKSFNTENKPEVVLVSGVSHESKYRVEHFNKPFMINISVWSSNMNIRKFYFIVNPSFHGNYKLPISDNSNNEVNFAINDIIAKAEAKKENINTKELLELQALIYRNK